MPFAARRFGSKRRVGGRKVNILGKRPSAAKRGYGRKWQEARKGYLAKHPFCAKCSSDDRLVLAVVVDHIKPHKGDMKLFWDRSNWQGLCVKCHNIKTATEDGGFGNARQ